MATSAQVAEFRQATQSLVALAQRDMRDFWRALDVEGNPLLVKEALLAFFPELVTGYGDAAAILGADWYDLLRDAPPSAASFRAVLASPPAVEQAEASARWALGPLFAAEPDPSQVLANLYGAAQRLVLEPYRRTVIGSAIRDPLPRGYARVPVGPTCRFCVMVASRGFVFRSRESAGDPDVTDRWHDDCNCDIVPGNRPGDLPEDYDLKALKRAYARGEGIGRDLDAGDSP